MPAPISPRDGLLYRLVRALLSPGARLALLLTLLCAAVCAVLLLRPQDLLTSGFGGGLPSWAAAVLFAFLYGVFAAAFVPRPVLNLAAGAVFGMRTGSAAALAGTVLGAGIALGMGRFLGQSALRPMLRARWLTAADRQLSRHGFRSTLVIRLLPGVPFAASNYAAAVSRVRWSAFLPATLLGSAPNTVAYVVAGSSAGSPTSPVFLVSFGFIAVSGAAATVVAWRRRSRPGRYPQTDGTAAGGPETPSGEATPTA